MRLLHVTDFHFQRHWFKWLLGKAKTCDAVALTGDLKNLWLVEQRKVSNSEQSKWLGDYLASFPVPIFICTGNHERDLDGEGLPTFMQEAAAANPHVRLDGCNEVFEGWRIVAVPFAPGKAMVAPAGPERVILLTHAPPAETKVSVGQGDMGDFDARALVEFLPDGSLVLSGHQHEPVRWHDKLGGSFCFNPGYQEKQPEPQFITLHLWARQTAALGDSADIIRMG